MWHIKLQFTTRKYKQSQTYNSGFSSFEMNNLVYGKMPQFKRYPVPEANVAFCSLYVLVVDFVTRFVFARVTVCMCCSRGGHQAAVAIPSRLAFFATSTPSPLMSLTTTQWRPFSAELSTGIFPASRSPPAAHRWEISIIFMFSYC